MNKQLQNISNPQVLSGIAICSSAALGAYSIKNIMEINKKLDIIVSEINSLKTKNEEDKRRNNISVSNLSRKMEDLNHKINLKPSKKIEKIVEVEVEEVEMEEDDEDDISDAVNNFLKK